MATRGATAAELILQHKPDVVLLDINLKGDGLDGIDVCRLAIEMTKTKVVIITAYSDAETRQRALAAGADEIMIKPINENALLAVLHSLEGEMRS
jgi:DNA-binding response OmpR family regulator